jgi:hypothetical protein
VAAVACAPVSINSQNAGPAPTGAGYHIPELQSQEDHHQKLNPENDLL